MTAPLHIPLAGPLAEVKVLDSADDAAAAELDALAARRSREDLDRDRAALQQARQALVAAAGEVTSMRGQIIADAEEQLLDLALGIARKVLMQEIHAERYELEPIVREALGHIPARQDVLVRLNPDDLRRCDVESLAGEDDGIRFAPDPAVPPAGCVVETPQGIVESSPGGGLEDIEQTLKEVR